MKYTINGKTYIQRELVLGQVQQLVKAVGNITFAELTITGIVGALGDDIYTALAVVLIPEGEKVKGRDLAAIALDLEEAPVATLVKVVSDFFGCNQLSSLLGTLDTLTNQIDKAMTGLNSSPACLQTETSQNASQSSGA